MSKPRMTARNEIFNQQVHSQIISSRYDLSKRSAGSYRMGVLYPIYCRNDIVPGDRFSISAAPFIRFMPMVSPSLTNVDVEVRYFFVPRRIIWNKWKNYISPSDANDAKLIEPYIENFTRMSSNEVVRYYNVANSLYDYMGCSCIPWFLTGGNNGIYGTPSWLPAEESLYFGKIAPYKRFTNAWTPYNFVPLPFSAYPFAAYNFIWNEYFRDENLQEEAIMDLLPGSANRPADFFLRRVNWSKDYFSSALPFVTQSIFNAPVVQDGMSIESLREASALTRWLEKQAIGGHRYQESILTHFGVRVPDEAAQIPVYLGGGKCPVQIGSVEQTSATVDFSGYTPQGNLAGKATAAESMFVDNVEFKEHGTLLGLMYIRPRALYANVTARDLFAKEDRHEYYWPDFANLGDEAVKCDELNPGYGAYDGNPDHGYQMRYASYRTSFDTVHGQLRPLESLESWTQARNWNDIPETGSFESVQTPHPISEDFIECKPSNRIFAVTEDQDNLIGEVYTYVDAVRPMPNYVDPKID